MACSRFLANLTVPEFFGRDSDPPCNIITCLVSADLHDDDNETFAAPADWLVKKSVPMTIVIANNNGFIFSLHPELLPKVVF